MSQRTGAGKCLRLLIALLFVMLTGAAAASTVGCAGASGTFDFNSLNAAVAAANPWGDTIVVSGTCTELVGIYNLNNLNIIGSNGAALVEPPGDNFQGDVLDISDDQNLTINGLTLRANPHTPDTAIAVVAIGNSSVTLKNVQIEGSSQTDGIDVSPTSNVTIQGGVVQNNPDGAGVFANGSGSNVNLRRGPGASCPLIQNNGEGLYGDNNASINIRQCALVFNNSDIGVAGLNNSAISIVSPPGTPNAIVIQNNAYGVLVAAGGSLTLNGPVLVTGNAYDGVRLRAARGSLGGAVGPTISGNGSAPAVCCVVNAGVSVTQGGTLDVIGATINGNSAPGVHITDNSSVRFLANSPVQITGNNSGVVLQYSSVALVVGPVIHGNGSDLTCASDSRAYGDGSTIGRMNCPGFQAQTNPGLGIKGKIVP